MSQPTPLPNHVLVAVLTTSGRWPTTGFESTPSHQKIRVVLEQAAKALNLTDISGWLATVGGNEVNISSAYVDAGLSGEIEIDFGPRAGGGGCDA